MTDVIWKPVNIDGYERFYEVSTDGRIRRTAHHAVIGKTNPFLPTREKSINIDKRGYAMVALYKGQEQKHISVHRLVAMTFIPNPNNLPQVNHIDENKLNNSVDNLEWCSNLYNSNYGTRGERIAKANTNGKKSKSIIGIKNDERVIFPSINEAARTLQISHSNIVSALKGRRNYAGGYTWHYQS